MPPVLSEPPTLLLPGLLPGRRDPDMPVSIADFDIMPADIPPDIWKRPGPPGTAEKPPREPCIRTPCADASLIAGGDNRASNATMVAETVRDGREPACTADVKAARKPMVSLSRWPAPPAATRHSAVVVSDAAD